MKTWRICTLDVWGNETDGYGINDYFTYVAECPESDLEDKTAFLIEHLIGDPNQYTWRDDCNGFIEVAHKDTGKPIFHITANYEY